MTLILTVANSRGVYQSSDYQLTDRDTGAPVSDRAGSKQLVASFKDLHLILAFTGVATWRVGSRTVRTVDWLSAQLKALPPESNLRAICRALAKKSEKWCGSSGSLTLVISVASVGKPFQVVEISNTDWGRKPPSVKRHFDIRVRTVQKPFHLISGFRDCVFNRERVLLKALARKMDATPKEVMTALSEINSVSADNSNGSVSKECWATAQFADGDDRRSATLNVGNQAGSISQLSGGMDFADWINKNFRAAPGEEIRLVQSAGVMVGPGGGAPVPGPVGEPKNFLISVSSVVGQLRSPSGQHCASIEFGPVSSTITARCNESATVPFAEIRLSEIQPISENFAKPMFPWPSLRSSLSVDGAAVPNDWEYTVCYWIEDGAHHVEIPQTSRGIRKVGFLGDDDELVIVVQGCVITWDSIEDRPTAVLEADVWWRARLDGTHG
jgi:hypothetical protein